MKKKRGLYEHPPESGVWWVQVFNGKTRHRKKVGPYGLAVKVYEKLKTQIREGRFFPSPQNPVFEDYVATYLKRTASTRLDSVGADRYALFFKEAPETKGKKMRDLTRGDFETYRERRLHEGEAPGCQRKRGPVGPTTVNKELRFAHAVFQHFIALVDEKGDVPLRNPVKGLSLSEPDHRTRYLKQDEEDRLRAALDPTDWPPVLVAMMTGVDRGVMFHLLWSQVNLEARTIQTERRKGRRGRPRTVVTPINTELLETLRALPSRLTSRWVFPHANTSGPENAEAFDRLIFKPALRKAGITGFRWKDLRHTFATRLRMDGQADLKSIAELLGHTSTRMTERYAHSNAGHALTLVQRLSRTAIATATTAATG